MTAQTRAAAPPLPSFLLPVAALRFCVVLLSCDKARLGRDIRQEFYCCSLQVSILKRSPLFLKIMTRNDVAQDFMIDCFLHEKHLDSGEILQATSLQHNGNEVLGK